VPLRAANIGNPSTRDRERGFDSKFQTQLHDDGVGAYRGAEPLSEGGRERSTAIDGN
jgi:hypothetical protein